MLPLNKVDFEINRFARLDKFTQADLNRVRCVAQVQQRIEESKLARFRKKGLTMSQEKLENERHYSSRMKLQLERAGYAKPHPRCELHAIISGGHALAEEARAVMAWCKMRIDDHYNGCWLPARFSDRPYMPQWLKRAAPHRNIHTHRYYSWLSDNINYVEINEVEDLVRKLRYMRFRLQSGSIPDDILTTSES